MYSSNQLPSHTRFTQGKIGWVLLWLLGVPLPLLLVLYLIKSLM